jgi:hypothetical protein
MPLPDSMTGLYGGMREIRKAPGQSDLSPRIYRILAAELNGEQNEELLKKYLKRIL